MNNPKFEFANFLVTHVCPCCSELAVLGVVSPKVCIAGVCMELKKVSQTEAELYIMKNFYMRLLVLLRIPKQFLVIEPMIYTE
jgi:hypothetical protein